VNRSLLFVENFINNMCGIFGIIPKKNIEPVLLRRMTNRLFQLSESRGKEAAGIAIRNKETIFVYKEPVAASQMIHSKDYLRVLDEAKDISAIIGHSRLVTDGIETHENNNQPVVKEGIVGIHNGIITNHKELWQKFPSLEEKYEVDTEILLSLIRMFLQEGGSLKSVIKKTFGLIEGAASTALMFRDLNKILIATNTGSLYLCEGDEFIVFTSESYILGKFLKKFRQKCKISQVKSGEGYLIGESLERFSFEGEVSNEKDYEFVNLDIIDRSPEVKKEEVFNVNKNINPWDLYNEVTPRINSLKRCSKCLLPETMPFIKFNQDGICNYCTGYRKRELKGKEALESFVSKYKGSNPDCVFTFSGGRDSSYGLHYVKKVLGMNPIAYSYDWGMITDLARRNQARLCGKLGVEHILISADIKKKRENIRKNVLAWLKKPDLGTVPLFMAGDKQYFYYANKLRKQLGAELVCLCVNPLEKTDFKHGFSGIKPRFYNEDVYTISFANKFRVASYYIKQFISNPAYLNSSLLDSFSAYASYYMIPHNYFFLFKYIKWDEEEIMKVLREEYDWEVAKDTKTTWRIGDGTAPFYNYIYYILGGFTENDTFRSNQIRESLITREEGLRFIEEENKPRAKSIKWYCDTIKVDFKDVLKSLGETCKLYDEK